MILIAIISNPKKLSGKLTNYFTGSPAYHIGFVDTEKNKFYDQNLIARRRLWPHYPPENVKLYKCPVNVTATMLEYWLDTNEDWYGVLDYLAFGIRKLFPRFKGSYKGAICSEAVANILVSAGWGNVFSQTLSPADFEKILDPYDPEGDHV